MRNVKTKPTPTQLAAENVLDPSTDKKKKGVKSLHFSAIIEREREGQFLSQPASQLTQTEPPVFL